MNACASLGAVKRSGVSCDLDPLVLIDGVPEPRLAVSSYSLNGQLDIRAARLYVDESEHALGKLAHRLTTEIMIALPLRLSDDQVRWPVLIHGVLKEVESGKSTGEREAWFDVVDAWSESLARPAEAIWWQASSGSVDARDSGSIQIGLKANRSENTFVINGQQVYVLQEGSGIVWTVADALKTIGCIAGLGLSIIGLPRDVASAELTQPINLTRSLSDVLETILKDYSLIVQRDIRREAGSVVERRYVRPISQGRPIRAVWADDEQPLADVLDVQAESPAHVARLWIAQADGWQIESTFNLVGGWDPALEGQADSEYDKNDSTDFTTYADVYRRWVLNEDGYYTQAPFSRGPAYDLNALFDTSDIVPQPLVLNSNLTLGDDGEPLKPVIEVSTNGGSEWVVIAMPSDILGDRAGIYLDPVTLPGDFLTAAKAGLARVRVTAVLASPKPVELSRWYGNAFSSTLPPLVHDLADVFRFQRVNSASIHYANVRSGILAADQVDHTHAMFRWLVDRMTRHANSGERIGGRATIELAGTWPLLRPGDRLLDVRGKGVAVDGHAQAMTDLGGTVQSIETRYEKHKTRGRRTKVTMTF